MLLYLIVFSISIIATYNAQNSKVCGINYYFHCFWAIIPAVIIAALRDPSVGTDTPNYIGFFEDAVKYNDSFVSYFLINHSLEPGFLLYNFLLANITQSVQVYYIITYFVVVGLMFKSAMRLRAYIKPHLFMLIFYMLFFSDSLNVMRQYMAMSFVVNAISLLFLHKYKRYVFWTVVACFFHTSAIISIIIGGAYYITRKFPLRKHLFIYLTVCLGAVFVVANLDLVSRIGILPTYVEKFENVYLAQSSEGGVSASHIVIYVASLLYVIYAHRNTPVMDFMLLMAILTLIFAFSANINAFLYRMALYFSIMLCFTIPYIYKNIQSKNVRYLSHVLLSLYVFYYFFSIVISGTNAVVPYSSSLVGL